MRVTDDDPTVDWTRPGVYRVTEGIYRIPLPMPNDGLHAVNIYALEDGDGLVLVDSGMDVPEARELLIEALRALDCTITDISSFLVTHFHRDHIGQAGVLHREFGINFKVGAGERAGLEFIKGAQGAPNFLVQTQILRRHGAPELATRVKDIAGLVDMAVEMPDEWLNDGDDIKVGARELRALATPGHTRGHVVFRDEAEARLFAGDHVLPHITPSIGLEAAVGVQPLGDFMDSLRMVRALPDTQLLPAHGPVTPSAHQRIDELLDHHVRRLQASLDVVGTDVLTAYEVARGLRWTRRERHLDEMDEFNQMLATTETVAHLDLLVSQGRLRRIEADGVFRYQAA